MNVRLHQQNKKKRQYRMKSINIYKYINEISYIKNFNNYIFKIIFKEFSK